MPANATSHRPTVAVPYADSARSDTSSPQQGEAFRSALDSVDQSKASENSRASKRRASTPGDDVSDRRDDATTRADDAEARNEAETEALAGEQRAEQNSEDPPSTESSGGGVGSDPPVLDSSEAGGSVRAEGTAVPDAGSADASSPTPGDAVSSAALAAANPGTHASVQQTPPVSSQSELLQAGQRLERGSLATSLAALGPDEASAGLPGTNTPGADAEAGSNPQSGKAPAGLELSSLPAQNGNTDAEFKLGQLAANKTLDAGKGADGQANQGQGANSRPVEAGPQGPGTVNRGGLETAGRGDLMSNLHNDPEPLPGSVRLRGLRGARLVVPTGDGQVIKARVDLSEEQVDVRLAAPEGSSQLAERRTAELRQALASHGMELGDFDVSTSQDSSNETATDGSDGDSSRSEDRATDNNRGTEVDPWGRPIGAEPSRGSAMDGRGALLDLRL